MVEPEAERGHVSDEVDRGGGGDLGSGQQLTFSALALDGTGFAT